MDTKKTIPEKSNAAAIKPDKETLHTPDPQENMEGPVSSLMHNVAESFDTTQSKKEADEEKEKKM